MEGAIGHGGENHKSKLNLNITIQVAFFHSCIDDRYKLTQKFNYYN